MKSRNDKKKSSDTRGTPAHKDKERKDDRDDKKKKGNPFSKALDKQKR